MDEKNKPFEFTMKSGNATLIIHSDLMKLTEEEREQWFEDEMAKGNPILLNIAKTVNESYRRFYKGEEA